MVVAASARPGRLELVDLEAVEARRSGPERERPGCRDGYDNGHIADGSGREEAAETQQPLFSWAKFAVEAPGLSPPRSRRSERATNAAEVVVSVPVCTGHQDADGRTTGDYPATYGWPLLLVHVCGPFLLTGNSPLAGGRRLLRAACSNDTWT